MQEADGHTHNALMPFVSSARTSPELAGWQSQLDMTIWSDSVVLCTACSCTIQESLLCKLSILVHISFLLTSKFHNTEAGPVVR